MYVPFKSYEILLTNENKPHARTHASIHPPTYTYAGYWVLSCFEIEFVLRDKKVFTYKF